jgi:monomeric isocitrate dehydrogenase
MFCVEALTFPFRVSCNLNCRAHDRNIIQKVNTYLKDHDTKGLDITIGMFSLAPERCNSRTVDALW